MPVQYEESLLLPLTTDLDIERRVADLIGRANSRQLWLLFLDEFNVQLPLVIPIEGLPYQPTEEEAARVVERIRELMGEIGACAVVTVLERYGVASLTAHDATWVRLLGDVCAQKGVVLRAQLLSHRTGVVLLAPEPSTA